MEQLIQAYRDRRLMLFVGAGVSMGLGLPSWSRLIDSMAKELGFDESIFRAYGSDLALAEYYRLTKGGIGSLRSELDIAWHSSGVDISKSRVHQLIAEMGFELVYTTNYDRWIEKAFDHYKKPYSKIAGLGDIAGVGDGTQIVKFHGDFSDDRSIVLDESSYFERLAFEAPLDIKLRSDVMGRSVLFIGYSLTDINIRFLFYKLANLWKDASRGAVQQPPSFIFTGRPNPIQEATLRQWNINMITAEGDDEGAALTQLLEKIQQGG